MKTGFFNRVPAWRDRQALGPKQHATRPAQIPTNWTLDSEYWIVTLKFSTPAALDAVQKEGLR